MLAFVWANQIFLVVMVADINLNEITKKHAVPPSKVSNGD